LKLQRKQFRVGYAKTTFLELQEKDRMSVKTARLLKEVLAVNNVECYPKKKQVVKEGWRREQSNRLTKYESITL
jgi:hypothetical protein